MGCFCVRIDRADQQFSAAHFITLGPNHCESLHGHDYHVAVEVQGPLGEAHYVVDFLALHAVLQEILAELDHGVLLPTEHPNIRVESKGEEVEARFGKRRWVFPREDCRLLPLPNTTAEQLAGWIGRQLLKRPLGEAGATLSRVRVEVQESPGFTAVYDSAAPEGLSG